ncbi:MAG TPA: methyltransferase [Anaerolineales bacterium]|nr:methyltransferase [Anaerolineales bacterium]
MVEYISSYPFVLALLAAALAEFSAILVRRTAPMVGKWLWGLAGILSALSAACLVWSFIWAVSLQTVQKSSSPAGFQAIGMLIVLPGGALLVWSVIALARQTIYAWPEARLITESPYNFLRRPMGVGIGLIALGFALLTNNQASWVWLLVWAIISPLLFELEEWELKMRLLGAENYLNRTPRYLPLFKIRLRR